MRWLARLLIPYDTAARKGLRDGYDWHRAIWELFPDRKNENREFLSRIEKKELYFQVYVLSIPEPEKPGWCSESDWGVKKIPPSFLEWPFYRFDLIANPTKSIKKEGDNGKPAKNGKRVALFQPEEQLGWLNRKGEQGGFKILNDPPLELDKAQRHSFRKKENYGSHYAVNFRGVLQVTDKEKFIATFQKGIGTAKAFGFGMLLLQPLSL